MGLKEWLSLDFSRRHDAHAAAATAAAAAADRKALQPHADDTEEDHTPARQHPTSGPPPPRHAAQHHPPPPPSVAASHRTARQPSYRSEWDDHGSVYYPSRQSEYVNPHEPAQDPLSRQRHTEHRGSARQFSPRSQASTAHHAPPSHTHPPLRHQRQSQSESAYNYARDDRAVPYEGYYPSAPQYHGQRPTSQQRLPHPQETPEAGRAIDARQYPTGSMAPQSFPPGHGGLQQRVPSQVEHEAPNAGTLRDRKANISSSEHQRNSLFDVIRFSWLTGGGRSSAQSESGRASHLATDGDRHPTDLQSQAVSEDAAIVMKGWLEKCGQQFKTWNWRYFVLREDGVLAYYADEQLKRLKGSINVGFQSKADISMQSNMIDKKFVFMIATPQRNMMISAPSQKMMTKWIAKLHAAGATPSEPWDPSKKTVKYFVRDAECPHEWKRYDDPTSYIHMEGCLMKRGHVNKNWKNRFFRIEKGELRYYTENQEQLKGAVPLKGTIVSPGMTQCPDGRKYYFVLTSKDGKFEMHLNAPNEQSMHRWIEALQEAQTALAGKGARDTVSGLALVIKHAEEIPLAKAEVVFHAPEEITVELERRMESLIVSSCKARTIPVGSQLIAVGDRSILRETYVTARQTLRASTFPLRLQFVLPPHKKGELIKKSRSGIENWKRRVVVVTNGEIHYYKQVTNGSSTDLKHRKSFSLYGCYLNLIHMPGRDFCIVVARSPSDKLVLQTRTEVERLEWASVIYCSIRLVSQGVTPGHIENLQLEISRDPSAVSSSDLNGSFKDESRPGF